MSTKKIDERRELLGKQMNQFIMKLAEWSTSSDKEEVLRFSTFISVLYNNNLKLLCTITGKCFGHVIERINNKDTTIWGDEAYIRGVISAITGDSSEKFDLGKVFSQESMAEFPPAIHEEFWKRLSMIVKVYTMLKEVDTSMP